MNESKVVSSTKLFCSNILDSTYTSSSLFRISMAEIALEMFLFFALTSITTWSVLVIAFSTLSIDSFRPSFEFIIIIVYNKMDESSET